MAGMTMYAKSPRPKVPEPVEGPGAFLFQFYLEFFRRNELLHK